MFKRRHVRDALGPASTRVRRGFTLVEAIIVVVILAILASLVVPRFGAVRRSEDRYAVDQIADLMRMWGYRTSIMTQQVGIWNDPQRGWIQLMIRDFDPNNPDDPPIWQPDKLSNEVVLPDGTQFTEVIFDGERQELGNWFIQSNADGSRPRLEIAMSGPAGVTRLILEPYSNSVQRVDSQGGGGIRGPIDLDRDVGERTPW